KQFGEVGIIHMQLAAEDFRQVLLMPVVLMMYQLNDGIFYFFNNPSVSVFYQFKSKPFKVLSKLFPRGFINGCFKGNLSKEDITCRNSQLVQFMLHSSYTPAANHVLYK